MPTNSKRAPRYDLNRSDRRRNLLIQLGLVSIVVVFAVALVLYIVLSHEKKPASGEQKAVRVTSSKLVTKEGSKDPKAVLSVYEDFLCPHCAEFEKKYGATVNQLIESGAIAVDYTMIDIVGRNARVDYSARSGAAAYCVADESIDAFRRFHAALFAQQPDETARSFPDNSALIETARQAGASGKVPDCINSGRYVPLVEGGADANGISATPTIKLNGEDFDVRQAPQALIDKVKSIVGNVPGLETPAPAPASSPAPVPAPAPAPKP